MCSSHIKKIEYKNNTLEMKIKPVKKYSLKLLHVLTRKTVLNV